MEFTILESHQHGFFLCLLWWQPWVGYCLATIQVSHFLDKRPVTGRLCLLSYEFLFGKVTGYWLALQGLHNPGFFQEVCDSQGILKLTGRCKKN